MKKLIAAILAKWNSLPKAVRTTLKTGAVTFAGVASGVIRHAYQNPGFCWTEHCLWGYTVSAVHAGGIALGAYLLHSPLEEEIVDPQQAQPAQN